MSEGARTASPYLDETWRRMAWIAPLAAVVWLILLTGFALLLEQTAPPPVELKPLEARFLELPPAAGLQGGESTPARPAPHIVVSAKPLVLPKTKAVPKHHETKPVAEVPASPFGTAKPSAAAPPSAANPSTASDTGVTGGTGTGSAAGLGSDSSGARAIYAPTPNIPDDMRGDAFQGVALAHFKVSYNGDVEITLLHPTSSPRLNGILLDTLKQWRFFPAMKNGVAVDSEFDVRIPISIQ